MELLESLPLERWAIVYFAAPHSGRCNVRMRRSRIADGLGILVNPPF